MIGILEAMLPVTTLVSLGLTVVTITTALLVVEEWWPSMLRAIKAEKRTVTQWFVLGVAISFAGAAVDNLYWGIAWTAFYMTADSADALSRFGVFVNVPFRQVATILAGYFHLRAAHSADKAWVRTVLYCSWLIGFYATCWLYYNFN